MSRLILLFLLLALPGLANAACKWVWVDQDHDASTPAVRKQLCDRVTDVPAIKAPSIRPIQTPAVKPIQAPTIPPIGTKKCTVQRVYESGRWVNKQVCR